MELVSKHIKQWPKIVAYSHQTFADICAKLSSGTPLAEICRADGMPSANTVRNWMEASENVSAAIARARLDGEDAIAADCLRIADESDYDPQHGKLRVWTRLELLKRWNPKKWGDRLSQEVTGSDGGPVQIIVNTGVRRDEDN